MSHVLVWVNENNDVQIGNGNGGVCVLIPNEDGALVAWSRFFLSLTDKFGSSDEQDLPGRFDCVEQHGIIDAVLAIMGKEIYLANMRATNSSSPSRDLDQARILERVCGEIAALKQVQA